MRIMKSRIDLALILPGEGAINNNLNTQLCLEAVTYVMHRCQMVTCRCLALFSRKISQHEANTRRGCLTTFEAGSFWI